MITSLAKEYGVQILPIDSEHSAIFQCLEGQKRENVDSLIVTASGGLYALGIPTRFKLQLQQTVYDIQLGIWGIKLLLIQPLYLIRA